jgi:hypothetical protein
MYSSNASIGCGGGSVGGDLQRIHGGTGCRSGIGDGTSGSRCCIGGCDGSSFSGRGSGFGDGLDSRSGRSDRCRRFFFFIATSCKSKGRNDGGQDERFLHDVRDLEKQGTVDVMPAWIFAPTWQDWTTCPFARRDCRHVCTCFQGLP